MSKRPASIIRKALGFYDSAFEAILSLAVFVWWPLFFTMGGTSSVGTERIIARYWSGMSRTWKTFLWVLHTIGCLFSALMSYFLVFFFKVRLRQSFIWVVWMVPWLLCSYFFVAIGCLCVGIRESFLGRLKTSDSSLSMVYETYSAARSSTECVSKAIVYPVVSSLMMCIIANFGILQSVLRPHPPDHVVNYFSNFFFPGILLCLLTILAYPSFLVDLGDRKMRDIVVNSEDRGDSRILQCLFLDNDKAGIRVFQILFDKDMLTFWTRAIYLTVSYILTAKNAL